MEQESQKNCSEATSKTNGANPKEIARVSIKIPPFWKNNPRLWFKQVESQFIASGISSDSTKYHTVVAAIESSILEQISDLILNPPAVELYSTLKNRLEATFSESEERKLKKLLTTVELCDKTPTQLLREMRDLSAGKLHESLLKSLWIQRLSTQAQAILSASDAENLDSLAKIADKIYEVQKPDNIFTMTQEQNRQNNCYNADNSRMNDMEEKLAELTHQIEALNRGSFKQNKYQRGRSRSRSRTQFCWYHAKFGYKASKCQQPCNFNTLTEN